MIDIAVVILNWNGSEFLKLFLPSVIKFSDNFNTEIWIADNGSTDGSTELASRLFPSVRILKLDKNYGFARGYNLALKSINAKYFVLLNSDVEVTEGWIQPLYELMEFDSSIAACMPKIADLKRKDFFEYAGASGGYIDYLGYPFCRGRMFETIEQDIGQYNDTQPVFWASGACMMVRSEEWVNAGGFDSRFFAHMEEIDLCWRLKNLGKKIMVCPDSVVYHLGGGTLPRGNSAKSYLNFRNSLIMMLKNLPAGEFYIIVIRMCLDWLAIFRFCLFLSFSEAVSVIKAHIDFIKMIPGIYKHRKICKSNISIFNHKEVLSKSLVIRYYLRQKRLFSQL